MNKFTPITISLLIILSLFLSSCNMVGQASRAAIDATPGQSPADEPALRTQSPSEEHYIYGAGREARYKDGELIYTHQDYLGSGRATTDTSGEKEEDNTYLPYGESLGASGERFSFTGKEAENDLIYFGARYYDADSGRFTQKDPIKDGRNHYAYANNNPLMFVDPAGMATQGIGQMYGLEYARGEGATPQFYWATSNTPWYHPEQFGVAAYNIVGSVLNGVLGALYAPDQLLALAVPSESDREGIWFGLAMAGQEYNSLRSLARSTANSPTTASGTRITSRTHTGTGEAATSTRTQYTASGGDKLIVDPNRDPAFAQQLSRSARSAIARRTSNTISRPTLVQQEVEAVFTRPSYTARDAVYNSNGGVAYMSEVMRCGVCREQAIYSHSLLAELGMRSQVAIGNGIFGREAGRHAWVEYTDTVTGQPYVLDTAFFRGVIDRATYYARYSIDTESVGYHTFMEP